jgi:fucose permease
VNLVSASDEQRMRWREIVRASIGVRSTIYGYIGGAFQLFASAAIVSWIPSYLNRFYSLAPEEAAVKAALIVLVGGIGMSGGGFVADRLSGRNVRNKLRVPAVYAVCCGVLFALAFALPHGGLQFALIVAAALFVGGHMGPVAALAAELNHPGLRATALSVVTLVYNLVGLAPGPFVVGALSDQFGLGAAMMVIPVACFIAAICFLIGSRYLPEDLRRFQKE